MTPQPILIVDDEPQLRAIVRATLTAEGYAVLEAANGLDGVRAWEQHAPHLIILDILMPEMDGLQALDHIRQRGDTPVVMLTRQAEEAHRVRAFELGADDYLSKPFSSRELVLRVKAVLRRTQSPAPTETAEVTAGDLRLDLAQRRVQIGARTVTLSRTEFALLTELARQPGRVLSREQLLTAVWGREYRDDTHLLRCAIYRLRQKLEADAEQPRYLQGAREVGYWLTVPEETQA